MVLTTFGLRFSVYFQSQFRMENSSMCTIHRFTAEYSANHIHAIRSEWDSNPDGCVIIELDDNGNVSAMFKTLSRDSAIRYIRDSVAAQFIVHLRAATGSNISIATTHGFTSRCGEWLYVHNGIIEDAENYLDFPYVDSLAIGEVLPKCDENGFSNPLPFSYANVIAVNVISGDIMCHKSVGGSLHYNPDTGSVSTRAIKGCDTPLRKVGWFRLNTENNRYATSEAKWLAKFYPDSVAATTPKKCSSVKTDERSVCPECGQWGEKSNVCRLYLPSDFRKVCGGEYTQSPEDANTCTCDKCGNEEGYCKTCGRVEYYPG